MIKIDLASFLPIYEQIKKEIKRKITLEVLKPHEPLPSIRDLASELIINPNTVARAYRELEREGFIYTRKGKGCYVSDNSASLIKKERDRTLNQILDQVIEEATKFKLSEEEIKSLFEKRLRLVMDEKKKRGKDD